MIISFVLYSAWKTLREAGYQSCISSISSEVYKLRATKDLALKNKGWKILSAEDTNSLISQVQGYDCGGVENQTLDLWNNKINIALRTTNHIELIMWSNGADEISGTNDDIIVPYGEKIPE